MDETNEMDESASTKLHKRHRDQSTGEQTVFKKPCVSTSEGLKDDVEEQQDETRNVDKLMHEVEHTTTEDERDTDDEEKRQTECSANAVKSQVLRDTNSGGLTANALQKPDETSNLDEQTQDGVEQKKRNGSEEDGVQMKTDDASSHQTRWDNCAALAEVKCSGDEEKQENLPRTEDSTHSTITQDNMKNKSEELKKSEADDGEHFNEQRGDLTDKVRERQGEDSGTEEMKGDKVEDKRNVTDAEANNQARCSEEFEGQMRKDLEEEKLSVQIRGEEGDAESVKCPDKSSHGINMTTGVNRATQNEVINSEDNKQDNRSLSEDSAHSSIVQTNTNIVKEADAPINPEETTDDYKKQKTYEDERTDKQIQRGTQTHYGLYNQGATCYLNSVLQVLFVTPEIHDRLDPKLQTDLQLRNVFKNLKKKACETETITETFGIKYVREQQDAAECLEMILHKINPKASEVFQGELTHTTKCSEGHIIIEETNPFWTLPLSLKDAHNETISVESSFKRIVDSKCNNKVYCNECNNKTEATSACEMKKSPQNLILLLKRFNLDYNTGSYVKSHCRVDVPPALQIENKTYKLYGMVDHIGSLRGGHYTATVLSSDGSTWYKCNDALVNKVEDQLFAETGTYNSRTVYLLMYRDVEAQKLFETKSKSVTDGDNSGENSPGARESGSKSGRTICQVFSYCTSLFLLCCCCWYCYRNGVPFYCLQPKLARICRFLNLCGLKFGCC